MPKSENQKRVYYVGGHSYSPDTSTPLCCDTGIFERVTLYKSPKGTFFTIRESNFDDVKIDGAAVEVLSESAARSFMDEHAAEIIIDNYNRVFGKPVQG